MRNSSKKGAGLGLGAIAVAVLRAEAASAASSKLLVFVQTADGWQSYVSRLTAEWYDFGVRPLATGTTLSECRVKTNLEIEQTIAAYTAERKREAIADALKKEQDDRKAAWAAAVRDKSQPRMAELVNYMGGGDYYYEYAKAYTDASPEWLERAAGFVKTPAYAKELRDLAQTRRNVAKAKAEQAKKDAAARVAASAPVASTSSDFTRQAGSIRPTLSPMYENPGLYNYRTQAYGSWKPMAWDK